MNYLFYGTESGRMQKEIDSIVHEMGNDCDVVTFDLNNVKMSDVSMEFMTAPFFSSHKVIVVRHCDFLSSNKEEDTAMLSEYLQNPEKNNTLILCCEHEKCDGRKKIVKLIQKCCKVKAFQSMDERDVRSYVIDRCRFLQIQLSQEELGFLMQQLPSESRLIDSELEKLACYPGKIDREVIRTLIVKPLEENVFQLSESMIKKKFDKAYSIYKDMRALNYDPVYLLAVLAGQFRFYYQVKVCQMMSKSEKRIAAELKAHPYRVKLTSQLVRHTDIHDLMWLMDRTLNCDVEIKTGKREKFLAFEMFLIQCQGEML